MSKRQANCFPPVSGKVLYESIFADQERDRILETISRGIYNIINNVENLLIDADILIKEKRYPRAAFLVVTADEEMAKVYILLDACRLDLSKHGSIITKLCQAFYDHVKKYAYNRIVRFPNPFNMHHVQELYDVSIKRWFPAETTSGEPDMPHNIVFNRDQNIYVDFSNWDNDWLVPDCSDRYAQGYLEGFMSPSEGGARIVSSTELEKLAKTKEAGLFEPSVLNIFNDIYRKIYINENTTNKVLETLITRFAKEIHKDIGIEIKSIVKSALVSWPIYHFLTI